MPGRKKRGPGRPQLGADARTVPTVVKFSARELAAIRQAVAQQNALAGERATVSSWIRDHALEALGLATARSKG